MGEQPPDGNVARQQLSLSARPKILDGLIGQAKLVRAIRGHFKSGRFPKAWLFSGPRGTGKTTTGRILALSYQCRHQETFGRPCQACRKLASQGMSNGTWGAFPIREMSAGQVSKIEDMRAALSGVYAGVMGIGRYRVYLMNEVQRSSPASITLFLDMLEDTPASTIFIFTTTEPSSLSDAFRFTMHQLRISGTGHGGSWKVAQRLLEKIGSELPADRLVEALGEAKVMSPRLIAQAVEKYAAGCETGGSHSCEWSTYCRYYDVVPRHYQRSLGFGRTISSQCGEERCEGVANASVAYLRRQLLESSEIGPRSDAIAKAISLMSVSNVEDAVIFSAICASCYELTRLFSKYRV